VGIVVEVVLQRAPQLAAHVLDFGGTPGVSLATRQAVAEHVHGNFADAEDLSRRRG
jgi:hypothetical protein